MFPRKYLSVFTKQISEDLDLKLLEMFKMYT